MSSSELINSSASFRIGYWLAEKKIRKLNFDGFETLCRKAGVDIVKLDLDEPLDQQGPIDVILHKLTDQIARAESGCKNAQQNIDRFQEYVAHHSDVIVIDPLQNVMKLFDRHQQYNLVKDCFSFVGIQDGSCFTPPFVELMCTDVETNMSALHSQGIQFPIVCKPTSAHGSIHCHEMSIIFSAAGLKDAEVPCIAQTFVNHNARLFKVFVLGDQQFVVQRPSVKNISAGNHETVFFNSSDISKSSATSFLTKMAESELSLPVIEPDADKLRSLALRLQQTFALDLFGIDIIIENVTGRYAVIDINTFPGYEDVPDFFHHLLEFVKQKQHEKKHVGNLPNCVSN